MLRTVGQYMGKIRRMASEFQGQFQEAMREAEMADLKKHVDEMSDAANGLHRFRSAGEREEGGRQLRPPIRSGTSTPAPPPAGTEPAGASPEAAAATARAAVA